MNNTVYGPATGITGASPNTFSTQVNGITIYGNTANQGNIASNAQSTAYGTYQQTPTLPAGYTYSQGSYINADTGEYHLIGTNAQGGQITLNGSIFNAQGQPAPPTGGITPATSYSSTPGVAQGLTPGQTITQSVNLGGIIGGLQQGGVLSLQAGPQLGGATSFSATGQPTTATYPNVSLIYVAGPVGTPPALIGLQNPDGSTSTTLTTDNYTLSVVDGQLYVSQGNQPTFGTAITNAQAEQLANAAAQSGNYLYSQGYNAGVGIPALVPVQGTNTQVSPLLSFAGQVPATYTNRYLGALPTLGNISNVLQGSQPLNLNLSTGQTPQQVQTQNTLQQTAGGILGTNLGQQPSTNVGTSPYLNYTPSNINTLLGPEALQQIAQNRTDYYTRQNPNNIYGGIVNPQELFNRLLLLEVASPYLAQNAARGFENLLYAPSNYLFGTKYQPNIPNAPPALTTLATNYLQYQLPTEISNYLGQATNIPTSTNPQLENVLRPFSELSDIVKPVATSIGASYPQALGYLGTPNQNPLRTAYNTAFLGSALALPVQSQGYGLGLGAIGTGINALMGYPKSSQQAFGSSYKMGVASAPLFEGAQLLGSQIAGPASEPNIVNPYLRFLAKTAPVSTIMGGLQAGQGALQGQTSPFGLAENFGIGYVSGTVLQGAGELFSQYGPKLLTSSQVGLFNRVIKDPDQGIELMNAKAKSDPTVQAGIDSAKTTLDTQKTTTINQVVAALRNIVAQFGEKPMEYEGYVQFQKDIDNVADMLSKAQPTATPPRQSGLAQISKVMSGEALPAEGTQGSDLINQAYKLLQDISNNPAYQLNPAEPTALGDSKAEVNKQIIAGLLAKLNTDLQTWDFANGAWKEPEDLEIYKQLLTNPAYKNVADMINPKAQSAITLNILKTDIISRVSNGKIDPADLRTLLTERLGSKFVNGLSDDQLRALSGLTYIKGGGFGGSGLALGNLDGLQTLLAKSTTSLDGTVGGAGAVIVQLPTGGYRLTTDIDSEFNVQGPELLAKAQANLKVIQDYYASIGKDPSTVKITPGKGIGEGTQYRIVDTAQIDPATGKALNLNDVNYQPDLRTKATLTTPDGIKVIDYREVLNDKLFNYPDPEKQVKALQDAQLILNTAKGAGLTNTLGQGGVSYELGSPTLLPSAYGNPFESGANPETTLRTSYDVNNYVKSLQNLLDENKNTLTPEQTTFLNKQIKAYSLFSDLLDKAYSTPQQVIDKLKIQIKDAPPEVGDALTDIVKSQLKNDVFLFGSNAYRAQLTGVEPTPIQKVRAALGIPETNPIQPGADLDIQLKNTQATYGDALEVTAKIWYGVNKAMIDAVADASPEELAILKTTYGLTDTQIATLQKGIPIYEIDGLNVLNTDGTHLTDIHYANENQDNYNELATQYRYGQKISESNPRVQKEGVSLTSVAEGLGAKGGAGLSPTTISNLGYGPLTREGLLSTTGLDEARLTETGYGSVIDSILKYGVKDQNGDITFASPADYRVKDPAKAIEYLMVMNAQNWYLTKTPQINELYDYFKEAGLITPEYDEEITNLQAAIKADPFNFRIEDFADGQTTLGKITAALLDRGQLDPVTAAAITQTPTPVQTPLTKIVEPITTPLTTQAQLTRIAPQTVSPTPLTAPAQTVSFDPLTTQQLTQYAQSLGLSPATLINSLPSNIVSFLQNTTNQTAKQAVLDSLIASAYAVQNGVTSNLAGSQVSLPLASPSSISSALASPSISPYNNLQSYASLSPLASNSQYPTVSDAYSTLSSLYSSGAISYPQYQAYLQYLSSLSSPSSPASQYLSSSGYPYQYQSGYPYPYPYPYPYQYPYPYSYSYPYPYPYSPPGSPPKKEVPIPTYGTYFGNLQSRNTLTPEEFTNIYTPSLLATLLPGLEPYFEKSYNPLNAASLGRPVAVPESVRRAGTTAYQPINENQLFQEEEQVPILV